MTQPADNVVIFTDGSCLGNPGPGGWAAVLIWGDHRQELSSGYARTTNNRMEVLAAIEALEQLQRPCHAKLHTDSRYLCDAVEKRWLANWQKNGWKTAAKKAVKNKDLWMRLLPQLEKHNVSFHWVEGHSGNPENERCDDLARAEASKPGLPPDPGA